MKINCNCLIFATIICFRVKTSWNIVDSWNFFLRLKSKLGLHHILLKTTKNFYQEIYSNCSWNAATTKHWKDWFQKLQPKKDNIFWQTKSLCKLQDWYRKPQYCLVPLPTEFHHKNTGIDPKLKVYQSLLAKRVCLLCNKTYCSSGALYRMKKLFIIESNFFNNVCSLSNEHFSTVSETTVVNWTEECSKKSNSNCIFVLGC